MIMQSWSTLKKYVFSPVHLYAEKFGFSLKTKVWPVPSKCSDRFGASDKNAPKVEESLTPSDDFPSFLFSYAYRMIFRFDMCTYFNEPLPIRFIIINYFTSINMRTGVVTSLTFRIRVFRLNPSLFVEYFNTQGHPSTFGGICFAAKDLFINFGGEVFVLKYRNINIY